MCLYWRDVNGRKFTMLCHKRGLQIPYRRLPACKCGRARDYITNFEQHGNKPFLPTILRGRVGGDAQHGRKEY